MIGQNLTLRSYQAIPKLRASESSALTGSVRFYSSFSELGLVACEKKSSARLRKSLESMGKQEAR